MLMITVARAESSRLTVNIDPDANDFPRIYPPNSHDVPHSAVLTSGLSW